MQFGLIVMAAWVLLTALWYILPTARADIYDLFLARTTTKWHAAALASVGPWTLPPPQRAAPSQRVSVSKCA